MLVEFSQGFNFDAIKTVGRLPSGLRPDKESERKTQKGKAGQAMAAKMIPVGSYQSLHIGPLRWSKADSEFMLLTPRLKRLLVIAA